MIVKVFSAGLSGIEAHRVEIEVDSSSGMASLLVIGLPDKAVQESRDRVKAAIGNAGYDFPLSNMTVNLAPADIKKEGPAYDLPIALGLLGVSSQLHPDGLARVAALGELALDGHTRPVKGVLPMALALRRAGHPTLMVPAENAAEAALVAGGLQVIPIAHLKEAVGYINGTFEIEPYEIDIDSYFAEHHLLDLDFADVRGQESAKRALEIAAAGGHNLLMIGPPGGGKTMLAKRIPGILPRMSIDEALETTKLHSIAGLTTKERPLVAVRPFRAPHHSISDAGLIGGGSYPRPGEVSLAHNGVLFLDELPEFNRTTLEVLRQPLEDGTVTIGRAAISLTFPADVMLIAAMNPCPCGYFGHPKKPCKCTSRQIAAYRGRISGPLLDRIDMHLEVAPVDYDKLADKREGESTAVIVERIQRARDIQADRFAPIRKARADLNDEADEQGPQSYADGHSYRRPLYCNAQMGDAEVRRFCELDKAGETLLRNAMDTLHLSARAYTRILKLARTIADLDRDTGDQPFERIQQHHLSEAIQYRLLDRSVEAL